MSNGKGDKRRPGDEKKFAETYDKVFGKKCVLNHKHTEECGDAKGIGGDGGSVGMGDATAGSV